MRDIVPNAKSLFEFAWEKAAVVVVFLVQRDADIPAG